MMNFLTESLNEPIDGDFLITSGRIENVNDLMVG